ncbi:glutaryl-CoA dehydrogenase (non-decarboxylating) [Sphingomonas sp. SORGH_AS 950]|uniref:acyl-CoA dehydrogenase family protein n=1 Tax=Sphingomonas sp. SORGH_AS_0950 TaxID=3041792 RepID=UPI0027848136|nr:acyl-CoA dehydrogenase family protein [Sphingomonas sp. SORGH_AS_0950]MDQ1159621.1 glutaryl-CoA dehydrogenase (non-decarboxylating) [Sphingomonas sp. SORGH_AS_0950]
MNEVVSSAFNEVADRARRFVKEHVEPEARKIDRDQCFPEALSRLIGSEGWLGIALPVQWGGGGIGPREYARVVEEFGWGCASARTLLTVHNMSAQALLKHGTEEQRARFLPALANGTSIIAFALTEPSAGSDANAIKARVVEAGDAYILAGEKVWCSFGAIADRFLTFAMCDGKPLALIVERDSPGFEIERTVDVFGTRGSEIATLRFKDVRVSVANRIGTVGAGIRFVANTALDHGRFSVACGSVGTIRACLDACADYTTQRHQGGGPIAQHQLVRRILTDGLVAVTSARALCERVAALRATKNPRAAAETALTKYYNATAAIKVANDAVALLGANGCSPDFPVSRYLRDATVAGIIEGTREIHQVSLASYALQRPWLHD